MKQDASVLMVCMNLEMAFEATDRCARAAEGETQAASVFVCLANEHMVGSLANDLLNSLQRQFPMQTSR